MPPVTAAGLLALGIALAPATAVAQQAVVTKPGAAPFRARGQLVCLTRHSVEVLLDGDVVVGALLPDSSPALTAEELESDHVGDQVDITAHRITSFYDPETQRGFVLQLESLQDHGPVDRAHLQAALASRARLYPDNLLPLPPGTTAAPSASSTNTLPADTVAAMRQWIERFPNYLADGTESYSEMISAPVAMVGPSRLLQYTASVTNGQSTRTAIKLDGAGTPAPYAALPVLHWPGGFGYMDAFVRPECDLRIQVVSGGNQGFTEPVDEYSFTGPANGCLGEMYFDYEEAFAPVRGRLWIAHGDHLPRRLTMDYLFPAAFILRDMQMQIDWTSLNIAGASYVLPQIAAVSLHTNTRLQRSKVTYTNYRHFAVTSAVHVIGRATAASAAAAPTAADLTGNWMATMYLKDQPAGNFALIITRDTQGNLVAYYVGSDSEKQVQLVVNTSQISFTMPVADGPPFEFHGTLNPAADEVDGITAMAGQSLRTVLKRQPPQ